MLLKHECNLDTTILISIAFWASFHLLHFYLLNWSPKCTILIIITIIIKKSSPSPKLALPWLSANLAVSIKILQNTMEEYCFFSGGAPCLSCLNISPWITFWLLDSNSFIYITYISDLVMSDLPCTELCVLRVCKKITRDMKLWMTLTAPRGACIPPGVSGTKPA